VRDSAVTASGETVLRFHKTNIIRIRPNGDMMLQTGGWCTATTGGPVKPRVAEGVPGIEVHS
jgi:hypothetical protein